MNDRLRKLGTYPMVALEQYKRELVASGTTVFDFGTGDPIEPTSPLIREALAQAIAPVSQYPSHEGLPELRTAIAAYLQRRFGVAVDAASEVLPTLGSKEALFHLPMVFAQVPSDKDLVLYGEPAYPVYEIAALFAEAWTYGVPLDAGNRYVMDPDAVPEAVLRRAAVVFLNSPRNPTGSSLPDAVMRSWVAARNQYGFLLVNDECYADLWFGEQRPKSLLEFGRKGCLAVHTLSKRSGMTGYRSGFVAGCSESIAKYRRFRAAMGVTPQEFVQRASIVAWRDEAHVAARRDVFAQKRTVLTTLCQQRGLSVWPSTASIYLWVGVPAGESDLAYAERCRERGILIAPGSWFGPRQERFCRIALVPSVDECRAAAAIWPR